ncbi:hypothetical protein D3C78_1226200 [compost metagenome]
MDTVASRRLLLSSTCTIALPLGTNCWAILTTIGRTPPGLLRTSITRPFIPCCSRAASSFSNRSAVFIENSVTSITPTPPCSIRAYTVSSAISSRIILYSRVAAVPARFTFTLASVPLGPRILDTASFRLKPSNDSPFTDSKISLGLIPAFSAGEPLIGDTTTTFPFSMDTSAPMPVKDPSICSENCCAVSGPM